MTILAGTDDGVYSVSPGDARRVLESRRVRDLYAYRNTLFAGTDAGLYVSKNGGETWSEPALVDRQVWQVRGDRDGVLYATTQPVGLYRSEDGGVTWRELTSLTAFPGADTWCLPLSPPQPARARALVIDEDDPRRIWVGVEVGGIMRTDDAGETWQFGCPGDNPDLHMMFAHPGRPEVLYASTGYGRLDGVAPYEEGNAGMFRSTDHGATWDYVWKGITPRYSRPLCVDDRLPRSVTVASAPSAFSSFKDDGGAGAMLFRSDDDCATWRSLCDSDHTPSAANIHGLARDPEAIGGVLIGTDTGEAWRVSNAAEWSLLASGLPPVMAMLGV